MCQILYWVFNYKSVFSFLLVCIMFFCFQTNSRSLLTFHIFCSPHQHRYRDGERTDLSTRSSPESPSPFTPLSPWCFYHLGTGIDSINFCFHFPFPLCYRDATWSEDARCDMPIWSCISACIFVGALLAFLITVTGSVWCQSWVMLYKILSTKLAFTLCDECLSGSTGGRKEIFGWNISLI